MLTSFSFAALSFLSFSAAFDDDDDEDGGLVDDGLDVDDKS